MPPRTVISVIALILGAALQVTAADEWLMKGHDVRRTGRSLGNGPRHAARVWRYRANDGLAINMEATVTSAGVFFGTWGLIRMGGPGPADWDKSDGRIYGLRLASGQPLWLPLLPAVTPYAYRYAGRVPTEQDRPAGPGLHWNYSNGTVEGTAAVDPANGLLYFGRGDGRLYAVDPQSGKVRWSFRTFDPARPDDPEGGGEIVGGPLWSPTTGSLPLPRLPRRIVPIRRSCCVTNPMPLTPWIAVANCFGGIQPPAPCRRFSMRRSRSRPTAGASTP